ncbi:MAG: hypothetical protein ACREMN_11420 [Gemmatimonadales bacterium]
MAQTLYARLQADVELELRRGAWYRVVELDDLQAVLDVNRRSVSVLRAWLEIRPRPPLRWSIVAGPSDAPDRRVPAALRGIYGVCPNCRGRAALPKRARALTCPRCRQEFAVKWEA